MDVSKISFSGWEGEVLEQGRQAGLSEVQVREVWHDCHGTSRTSRSSRSADEIGDIDTLSPRSCVARMMAGPTALCAVTGVKLPKCPSLQSPLPSSLRSG